MSKRRWVASPVDPQCLRRGPYLLARLCPPHETAYWGLFVLTEEGLFVISRRYDWRTPATATSTGTRWGSKVITLREWNWENQEAPFPATVAESRFVGKLLRLERAELERSRWEARLANIKERT